MRVFWGCLFFFLLPVLVTGQNFKPALHPDPYTPADTNALFLTIDNANFLKNNEFFNPYVEGYTKLGFFFNPRLTYLLSERTALSAGAHFLKYSGSDGFQDITPVFSVEHRFNPRLRLVMGTLRNEHRHRLIDPIYHFENYLDQHVENGLQFLVDHPLARGDIWINWEQFILRGSDFRERFEAGISADFRLLESEQKLSLEAPFQMLVQHKGGQINRSDKPVSTLYNMAAGLSLQLHTGSPLLSSLTFRNQLVLFRDGSPQKVQPYSRGRALYSNLILTRKALSLELSYWQARRFLSFSGNPIFQSYSLKKANAMNPDRELIVGRLRYSRKYQHLTFLVNADTYWDPRNHSTDFGFGIYLLLNTQLILTNKIESR